MHILELLVVYILFVVLIIIYIELNDCVLIENKI